MHHSLKSRLIAVCLGIGFSCSIVQSAPSDNSFTAPEPPPPTAQSIKSPHVAGAATVTPSKPSYSVTPHSPIRVSYQHALYDSMVVDAGEQHLFAAHPGSEKITVLNLSSGGLHEYHSGPIDGIAIDVQDGKVFMAGDNQAMRVLDRQSLVRIDEFLLNGRAGSIAFDPDNHMLYVDHATQTDAWVYNAKTHQEVDKIILDGQPGDIVYDSGTGKLYQTIVDKNLVDLIDSHTNKVSAQWPTAPVNNPSCIAVDDLLHRVLVAGSNGQVIAFDSTLGIPIASTSIASDIGQIAYDSNEQRLFCASSDGLVSVVQVTRDGLNYLGDFKTHPGAKSIALNVTKSNIDVWVSYSDDSGSYLQCFVAPR